MSEKVSLDKITDQVIGAAIEVHRELLIREQIAGPNRGICTKQILIDKNYPEPLRSPRSLR